MSCGPVNTNYNRDCGECFDIDRYELKRVVFCHPEEAEAVKNGLKVEDIRVITSSIMDRKTILHTKDVTVRFTGNVGMSNEDFKNNQISLIYEIY